MRRTLLAFFGLVFVGYWLWTHEGSGDRQAALEPVHPSILRLLPETEHLDLRSWLQAEIRLEHGRSRSSAAVERLKRKALTLNRSEIEDLEQMAGNLSQSGNERDLAIYMISLATGTARNGPEPTP